MTATPTGSTSVVSTISTPAPLWTGCRSSLTGSALFVNYVSKLPDGTTGTRLSFGTDSEGRIWASGEQYGLIGNDLSHRYGPKATRQDGHGIFEDGFDGIAYGGATKAFADGSLLTLHLSYTHMDEGHVGGQFQPYFGTEQAAPVGFFDDYYNGGNPDADD